MRILIGKDLWRKVVSAVGMAIGLFLSSINSSTYKMLFANTLFLPQKTSPYSPFFTDEDQGVIDTAGP